MSEPHALPPTDPEPGRPDDAAPEAALVDLPGQAALRPWACSRCGHWQRWFPPGPPPDCPVCRDVRAGLPAAGWDFRTPEQVDAALECWVEEDVIDGVRAHRCRPRFGIDPVGWVVTAEDGSQVGVEAAPWYDDAALARLQGVRALVASHVHSYGALWRVQDAVRPPVVAVGVADLPWTTAFRVTWPVDDVLELAPGITAHVVGGHFPGQLAVHDAGRGALFCGDMLKVDVDPQRRTPRALSTHKAYEVQVPLSHGEVRRHREQVETLDFEHVFTPFGHGPGVTTKHVLALFDRILGGAPSTRPVPLEDLA